MIKDNTMAKWNGKYITNLNKSEMLEYCRYLEKNNRKLTYMLNSVEISVRECVVKMDRCSHNLDRVFCKLKEAEKEYERIENTKVAEQVS